MAHQPQLWRTKLCFAKASYQNHSICVSHAVMSNSLRCNLQGSSVYEFSRQEYWSGLLFPSPEELFSSCQPSETSHGRVTKPPLPGGHFFFEALSSLGFWDTKLSWVSSCLIGWTFAVSFAYYSSLPPPSHPQFPTSQYLELQACLWNSSLTLPRWFHGFWNYLHVHDFQIILAALANTLHPRFVSLTAYSSYNHLKIIMANNGSFAVPFQISTSTTLSISVNAITLTQLLKPQTGHTPFIPLYCSHQYPISWPAI